MEFKDKIKKLRKQNKWTQEDLAKNLYISRTAVSKWESGCGYPNIDTLKDIAKLFNITIDELLSGEEVIDIAKKENITNIKNTTNFIQGLLDTISILYIFLPLYARSTKDFVYSVSLISNNDIGNVIKISYIILLLTITLIGVLKLIFNFTNNNKIQKILSMTSFIFQIIAILFFIVTRQIYLTIIIFIVMIIKILVITKNYTNYYKKCQEN